MTVPAAPRISEEFSATCLPMTVFSTRTSSPSRLLTTSCEHSWFSVGDKQTDRDHNVISSTSTRFWRRTNVKKNMGSATTSKSLTFWVWLKIPMWKLLKVHIKWHVWHECILTARLFCDGASPCGYRQWADYEAALWLRCRCTGRSSVHLRDGRQQDKKRDKHGNSYARISRHVIRDVFVFFCI